MKITKEEALALTKVLHAHCDHGSCLSDASKTSHQETLEDLQARLTDYLIYGDEETSEDEHECCDHGDEEEEDDEKAEDDDEDEEDSSDEEDEEEDEEDTDEESDSEDDESDEPDEEDEPDVDGYVSAGDLHGLKSVKTVSDEGNLEFESDEEDDEAGRVDVLIGGYHEATITHLRRKGKELHVLDIDGEWRVYHVAKFPTAWVDLLPLNELLKIED